MVRKRSRRRPSSRLCTFGGHGADTDIIVASAKAYLSALNKLLVATGRFGEPETAAEVAV